MYSNGLDVAVAVLVAVAKIERIQVVPGKAGAEVSKRKKL